MNIYFFYSGKQGSITGGLFINIALNHWIAMDNEPHVNPTTTPASIIFLQGYGKRLTAATIQITPVDTEQLMICRRFVA